MKQAPTGGAGCEWLTSTITLPAVNSASSSACKPTGIASALERYASGIPFPEDAGSLGKQLVVLTCRQHIESARDPWDQIRGGFAVLKCPQRSTRTQLVKNRSILEVCPRFHRRWVDACDRSERDSFNPDFRVEVCSAVEWALLQQRIPARRPGIAPCRNRLQTVEPPGDVYVLCKWCMALAPVTRYRGEAKIGDAQSIQRNIRPLAHVAVEQGRITIQCGLGIFIICRIG